MEATFTKSLAGTERVYIFGQVTTTGYTGLHVQIPGSKANRAYGLSVTTKEPLPKKLAKWFEAALKNGGDVRSLANTGKGYLIAQFAVREPGLVHVQISGEEGNRPYGITFDVKNAELEAYVSAEVEDYEAAIGPEDEFVIQ